MSIESIPVSTWNIQGSLSDTERAEKVAERIKGQQDLIVTLPDAWHENSEASAPSERKRQFEDADFAAIGYTAHSAKFREDRPDDNAARYGFLTLTHNSLPLIEEVKELQLGTRPAHHLRVDLAGTALNVISLYLNDQSEANRLAQLNALRPTLADIHDEPVVLMGDFNAMHAESAPARLLRTGLVRKAAPHITAKNNTLTRLIGMAEGEVMTRLLASGFHDAEPDRQPTMPSSLPLFQLDHIMFRHGLRGARIVVEKPERVTPSGLTDHVQLRSTVSLEHHPHHH